MIWELWFRTAFLDTELASRGILLLNHVNFNRFNGSKAMVEVEKKISSVEPSKLGIKKAYTPPEPLGVRQHCEADTRRRGHRE
jgi:hypothetical protein